LEENPELTVEEEHRRAEEEDALKEVMPSYCLKVARRVFDVMGHFHSAEFSLEKAVEEAQGLGEKIRGLNAGLSHMTKQRLDEHIHALRLQLVRASSAAEHGLENEKLRFEQVFEVVKVWEPEFGEAAVRATLGECGPVDADHPSINRFMFNKWLSKICMALEEEQSHTAVRDLLMHAEKVKGLMPSVALNGSLHEMSVNELREVGDLPEDDVYALFQAPSPALPLPKPRASFSRP
jgi:hypothetical protein